MLFGWDDLMPLDTVIAKTRTRALNRQNFDVDRVTDLGITWQDKHPKRPDGAYVATKMRDRKGNALVLADSAVRGACRLVGVRPKAFNHCADRNAFPEFLRNSWDNPARTGDRSLKVRTGFDENGIDEVVSAILPGKYQIRDANEQLAYFAGLIQENLGPIKGVSVEEHGFGEALSYRMIVGNNIMPKETDGRGQFMSFCLRMSETGLMQDEISLGLYRLICKNGAMADEQANIASWTHKSDIIDYLNKVGGMVMRAGAISQIWSRTFTQLAATKLDRPALDYLFDMKAHRLITEGHYDAASAHAMSGMEPGETQYDLYNLLTRGSQDLPSLQQRQSAERNSMKIFAEGDGVMKKLENARIHREQADATQAAREAGNIGRIGTPGHERPMPAFAQHLRDLGGEVI